MPTVLLIDLATVSADSISSLRLDVCTHSGLRHYKLVYTYQNETLHDTGSFIASTTLRLLSYLESLLQLPSHLHILLEMVKFERDLYT